MDTQIARLQDLLDKTLINRSNTLEILEAGCGSMMHIYFGIDTHITGIDISEMQLSRNQDIDEKIIGDIQSYDLQSSSFDIIICWNVLEHVQNPREALSRFVKALKQDGMIILGLPNGLSLKGLFTKYTPYIFHVWAYRHLFGIAEAGKNDNAPFRTILSHEIFPYAIKRFAFHNGLKVIYFASYDTEFYKMKMGFFFIIKRLIKFLSFGVLGDTDFTIVLQKA